MSICHLKYVQMCQGVFGGAAEEQRWSAGEQRGRFGVAAGKPQGATARTPCGHLYGIFKILILEPYSELVIKEIIQNLNFSLEILAIVYGI